MEKRDLYDINKKLTGETIFKGDTIPEGKYIIVVLATIQNSKGEFLVQKRSEQKGGKYAFTGGHVKTGETSKEGIISEIQEEIGLKVEPQELKHIFSGRVDSRQVFFDSYYIKKDFDISDLVLQKEEVADVQWNTIEEIRQFIDNGQFFENHIEEVERTIEIFKQQGEDITRLN